MRARKRSLKGWFGALVDRGVLTEVAVDGEPLYARTTDLDALAAAVPTDRVRLLPAFDQYVLGPGTRDQRIIAPARRPLISKVAGWISPVVVAGGRVIGTWAAEGGTLSVQLFSEAGPADRAALNAEVAVLERVLGRRLTTSVVTV